MNARGKIGITLTVVLALLGAWTLFSPFITGHQPVGQIWTAATRSDVWIGGILLLVSVLSLVLSSVAQLGELEGAARSRELGTPTN